MFQEFKSEITIFFAVVLVAIIITMAGIWLLASTPTPSPSPAPSLQMEFTPGDEFTVIGTVLEVDRSQMQIDGPAVVRLGTEENREVRVLIEAEAVAVCKTSALPFPAEGDEIEVFGKAENANTLRPCDSPDHYITILLSPALDDTSNWQTYRNDEFGFELKYPEGWRASFMEANDSVELTTAEPDDYLHGVGLPEEGHAWIQIFASPENINIPQGIERMELGPENVVRREAKLLEENERKFLFVSSYWEGDESAETWFETFDQILSTFRFVGEAAVSTGVLTSEGVLSNPVMYHGQEIEVHGVIELIPFVDSFGLGGAAPGFKTGLGNLGVSNWDRVNDAAQKKSEVIVRAMFDEESNFLSFPNDCAECFRDITPQ